jgi:hypothetical protein
VILIQLRIHRINLSLPKRVIERVVDSRWRNSEPRSGRTIDHHRFCFTAQLLVRYHISQLWQLLQLRNQLGRHRIQLRLVRIFQRVLVLGPAHHIVDAQILHRLHVKLDALDLFQLPCQAIDDFSRGHLSHFQWL